jgi:hypothetical protein
VIPYASIISYAALGAACAWGAWSVQGWRMGEQLSQLKTEYATAQARAVERAHSETIKLQANADKAARASAARQAKMADDADSARSAADRLRVELAAALLMPGNTCTSSHTETVSELLAQCGKSYSDMAAEADKRSSEVIQLLDAWPSAKP